MFFIFEIARPFQAKPSWVMFKNHKRAVWLWFSIGWVNIDYASFVRALVKINPIDSGAASDAAGEDEPGVLVVKHD